MNLVAHHWTALARAAACDHLRPDAAKRLARCEGRIDVEQSERGDRPLRRHLDRTWIRDGLAQELKATAQPQDQGTGRARSASLDRLGQTGRPEPVEGP